MMNYRLLSIYAVLTFLLPVNIQSTLASEADTANGTSQTAVNSEESSYLDNLLEELFVLFSKEDISQATVETETEKQVTTSESSRSKHPEVAEIEAEPELTPEEEHLLALKEWKTTLPTFDEKTKQTKFIEAIAPAAVLIADAQGIYPSVMIAQAGLESAWGQSDLAQSYNNLMGTKGSWNGKSVTARTREDVNGESVYINAGFSVYDSWGDSLHRYGMLMRNGLKHNAEFYSGTWRENTESYQDATNWLQGRYATDSSYASKLNQTIQSFNLDQYDDIESFDSSLEDSLKQLALNN